MKLKLGDSTVTLVKAMPLGKEKPGHKYCKRVPLGGGMGYKYFYPGSKGCSGEGQTEKHYSYAEARKMHPQDFDPNKSKFAVSEKRAKDIVNFKFGERLSDKIEMTEGLYKKSGQVAPQRGHLKEAFVLLAIEIEEGWVHDMNDAIYYLDNMYDNIKDSKDPDDQAKVMMIDRFMTHTAVLKDLRTPEVNGLKDLEAQWHSASQTWKAVKDDFIQAYGEALNPKAWEFIPSGHIKGQDVVADALLKSKDGRRHVAAAISTKWVQDVRISLKEGTYKTGLIDWMKATDSPLLTGAADKLLEIHQNAGKYADDLGITGKDRRAIMAIKTKQELKALCDADPEFATDLAWMMINKAVTAHEDKRAENTIINATVVRSGGAIEILSCRASTFLRGWNEFLQDGKIYISFEKAKGGKVKLKDKKSYPLYGDINIDIEKPDGSITNLVTGSARNSDDRYGARVSSNLTTEIMRKYSTEREKKSIFDLVANNDGFEGFRLKSIDVDLEKAKTSGPTTTKQVLGQSRPNVKYIRKEITKQGKVRYIYKEAAQRHPKADEEHKKKKHQFISSTDSVDAGYQSLFEEACQEIDDIHFININAGTTAVRFTQDLGMFFDFLNVGKAQRDLEEFQTAAGSYNINRGRIGFCLSNFPKDTDELTKKLVMLHDVGHAFFYGTLRMKDNKPLTEEDFKELDKGFVKDASKFIDEFGKLDKKMRQTAADSIDPEEKVEGMNKDELEALAIAQQFVDEYAATDDMEHFAQAFTYYFLLPEKLKKKEKDVYQHFNGYFEKYKD